MKYQHMSMLMAVQSPKQSAPAMQVLCVDLLVVQPFDCAWFDSTSYAGLVTPRAFPGQMRP